VRLNKCQLRLKNKPNKTVSDCFSVLFSECATSFKRVILTYTYLLTYLQFMTGSPMLNTGSLVFVITCDRVFNLSLPKSRLYTVVHPCALLCISILHAKVSVCNGQIDRQIYEKHDAAHRQDRHMHSLYLS